MKGGIGVVLRAADEQPIGAVVGLIDDLCSVRVHGGRLGDAGAVEIQGQHLCRWIQNGGDVHPLVLDDRFAHRLSAHRAAGNDRRAQPLALRFDREPVRRPLPEVDDRPRRAGRQEQPGRDADGVLAVQRLPGQLQVGLVAGHQQDAALPLLDEAVGAAAHRRVEVVARGILSVSVEQVAGDQTGFTDAIEKLVPLLRLFVDGVGEPEKRGGNREDEDDEYALDHLGNAPRGCGGAISTRRR